MAHLSLKLGRGLGVAAAASSFFYTQQRNKAVQADSRPAGPPVYLSTRSNLVGPRLSHWSPYWRIEATESLSPARQRKGVDTVVRMRRRRTWS